MASLTVRGSSKGMARALGAVAAAPLMGLVPVRAGGGMTGGSALPAMFVATRTMAHGVKPPKLNFDVNAAPESPHNLIAYIRDEEGSNQCKQLRKKGLVTGVVYGGGSQLSKKHYRRIARGENVLQNRFWKDRTLTERQQLISLELKSMTQMMNSTTFLRHPTILHVCEINDEIRQLIAENEPLEVVLERARQCAAYHKVETVARQVGFHPITDIPQNVTFMRLPQSFERLQRQSERNRNQEAHVG